MRAMDKIIKSAVTCVFTLAAANALISPANAAATDQQMEKCYGIVKAGMNDCSTKTQSCASSATKDRQPDAFIFLPKGTCNKIVGGSLSIPKTDTTNK